MDAFADGITAAQVLSFLETNAHPLARARTPDGVSQVWLVVTVSWLIEMAGGFDEMDKRDVHVIPA